MDTRIRIRTRPDAELAYCTCDVCCKQGSKSRPWLKSSMLMRTMTHVLVPGTAIGNLTELTDWIMAADKVLTF